MKIKETQSSSGGLIQEFFNADGNRVKVIHQAGKNFSGRMAEMEGREQRTAKKSKKA